MFRLVYYLFILFICTGCHFPSAGNSASQYTQHPKDTTIYGTRYLFFGEDSVYQYTENQGIKVIYGHAHSLSPLHYIVYDSLHRIKEAGWIRDTVLLYVSSLYTEPDTTWFYRSDWFERYYDNGTIYQQGYAGYDDEESFLRGYHHWEEYEEYAPEGWMSTIFKGTTMWGIYQVENFYPNGQRKEIYGSELDYAKEWDEEGNLQQEHTFRSLPAADPEMPGFDYILTVITTRQYYPSGRLKAIKRSKRYPESVTCPCGEWIYYNEQGKIIRREDYPPCDSYDLECDTI